MRQRSRIASAAVGLLTIATLGSCGQAQPRPTPTPQTTPATTTLPPAPKQPFTLTLAGYGTDEEQQAYEQVARDYSDSHPGIHVQVMWAPDHDSLLEPIRDHGPTPDVFLASRDDLPWLEQDHDSRPLGELLDERGVDFGDNYARDAMEAFSDANDLQCMPLSVSPEVIYYNTDLIDFDKLLAKGLITSPVTPQSWTWDQFVAAARFAARPRNHALGVAIEPTLEQLAPFILSGGGKLFDSLTTPTTSTLSSDASQQALATTLTLLRDESVAATPDELDQRSAVQRFENGEVGMIEGYRSLTPLLRRMPGLHFDVMPIPTLSSAATVGDITGFCLGAGSTHSSAAADLIAYLVGDKATETLTAAGYVVPANTDVLTSPVFLQPGRAPENAAVFSSAIRTIQQLMPDMTDPSQISTLIDPQLRELLSAGTLTLPDETQSIDAAVSREFGVLSPSPSP